MAAGVVLVCTSSKERSNSFYLAFWLISCMFSSRNIWRCRSNIYCFWSAIACAAL